MQCTPCKLLQPKYFWTFSQHSSNGSPETPRKSEYLERFLKKLEEKAEFEEKAKLEEKVTYEEHSTLEEEVQKILLEEV